MIQNQKTNIDFQNQEIIQKVSNQIENEVREEIEAKFYQPYPQFPLLKDKLYHVFEEFKDHIDDDVSEYVEDQMCDLVYDLISTKAHQIFNNIRKEISEAKNILAPINTKITSTKLP